MKKKLKPKKIIILSSQDPHIPKDPLIFMGDKHFFANSFFPKFEIDESVPFPDNFYGKEGFKKKTKENKK